MEDPKRLEEGFGPGAFGSDDGDIPGKKAAGNIIHNLSKETEPKSITTSDQPEDQREQQPLIKQKTKRVATLDAFRGLTVVVRRANFPASYQPNL